MISKVLVFVLICVNIGLSVSFTSFKGLNIKYDTHPDTFETETARTIPSIQKAGKENLKLIKAVVKENYIQNKNRTKREILKENMCPCVRSDVQVECTCSCQTDLKCSCECNYECTESTTSVVPTTTNLIKTTIKPSTARISSSIAPEQSTTSTSSKLTLEPAKSITSSTLTPTPAKSTISSTPTPNLASSTTPSKLTLEPASSTTSNTLTPTAASSKISSTLTPKPASSTASSTFTPKPTSSTTPSKLTPEPANSTTSSAFTPEPASLTTSSTLSPEPASSTTSNTLTPFPVKPETASTIPPTSATSTPVLTGSVSVANYTCILMKISISLKVEYEKINGSLGTATVTAPSESVVSGSCSNTQQRISYTWPVTVAQARRKRSLYNNNITLLLSLNCKSYAVKSILGTIYKDTKTFPDADLTNDSTVSFGSEYDDLGVLTTSVGYSRVCETTTSVTVGNVDVDLSNVHMQVFQNSSNVAAYDEAVVCTSDIAAHSTQLQNAGSSTAIIVMVSLVAVAGVLVLIATFIRRQLPR